MSRLRWSLKHRTCSGAGIANRPPRATATWGLRSGAAQERDGIVGRVETSREAIALSQGASQVAGERAAGVVIPRVEAEAVGLGKQVASIEAERLHSTEGAQSFDVAVGVETEATLSAPPGRRKSALAVVPRQPRAQTGVLGDSRLRQPPPDVRLEFVVTGAFACTRRRLPLRAEWRARLSRHSPGDRPSPGMPGTPQPTGNLP